MRGRRPSVLPIADPATVVPPPPRGLPAKLRKQWRTVLADLIERKIYSASMEGLIEMYLTSVWIVAECRRDMAKNGVFIATEGGKTRPHPAAAMMSKHQDLVARLGAEMGLTPASRSRKAMQPETKSDDDDASALGL